MQKQKTFGRRSVSELLDTDLEVFEIFIQTSGRGEVVDELRDAALRKGIRIVTASRLEIERLAPGMNHQGVVAFYKPPKVLNLEELLQEIDDEETSPLLMLDGVEDPRNLGAIIRSAEVFGAGGVIIRRHRSASVTPAAVKTSSGAALRLPIVEVANLDQAIRSLKEYNYWIYGLVSDGKVSIWDADLSSKSVFVLGSEGAGLSKLLCKRSDELLYIPQRGKIGSLNVSVAASVVMAEWMRQMVADERIK